MFGGGPEHPKRAMVEDWSIDVDGVRRALDGILETEAQERCTTLDEIGLRYGTDKASSGHKYLAHYERVLTHRCATTLSP